MHFLLLSVKKDSR